MLPTLETGSIELVVTSPPYDALRTYDGIKPFTWSDFEIVARELYRVLCDGGVLCWIVGDSVVKGSETLTSAKQKIYFRELCGFLIHDTMIYEKTNFGHPEKVRYHQLFEYVFVLSKGTPRCFNPIKDKQNVWAGHTPFGTRTVRQKDGTMKPSDNRARTPEFGMRGNIWAGLTAGQEEICAAIAHPAMMPFWLARDLIYSWSNPGDLVLDPFFGSGQVGKAAALLGRRWLGIEINERYVADAERRTAQMGIVYELQN